MYNIFQNQCSTKKQFKPWYKSESCVYNASEATRRRKKGGKKAFSTKLRNLRQRKKTGHEEEVFVALNAPFFFSF